MPFADDVRAGLTARPKTLPAKYFYDELGSLLFEAITLLPEYYLTRAESQILIAHADDIIAAAQPERLIELGSGSAVKTRILIGAALRQRPNLEYVTIDISRSSLDATAKALAAEYPTLTVRSLEADYYEGLSRLGRAQAGSATRSRSLALFLGSNIGNFDPPEQQRFLKAIREVLLPDDVLLLGTDLKKDRAVLEAAYDDALGITAAFNLNVIERINRDLDGTFDLRSFTHRAFYNEGASRIEMHIVSARDQQVKIGALDLDVNFTAGETIHTESSYKFSLDDIRALASRSGFSLERALTDAQNRFSCNLLYCT